MATATESRPQSFAEFIGQESLKTKAQYAIGGALARGEPLGHCLITSSGIGGVGKTTWAHVLANESFAPLHMTSGGCIQSAVDLRHVLIRLTQENPMVLIDEFHAIGRSAAEELLLVLEDNVLNVNLGLQRTAIRIEIPPFTLIGCTTQAERISGPLLQRFGLLFHLEPYSTTEMMTIIQGIFERWNLPIDRDAAKNLAQISHGIPRIGRRRAERVRDMAQAKRATTVTPEIVADAMRIEGIDHVGLTVQQRAVLVALAASHPRPVSARSLAMSLGISISSLTTTMEPTLVRLQMLSIGSGGRLLTDKGVNHLETVREEYEAS